MAGRLVVVGTPIGNLEDLSPRAAAALAGAGAICCEDTRRTRALLSALAIPAPRLIRLDAHTEREVAPRVAGLVAGGEVVALVSDAGMPSVSDPGADLVKVVADRGLAVEVVPGPSAVSAALAVSGLPADQYHFAGFLPRKGRGRSTALDAVARSSVTTVIYEAPGRVGATLADLALRGLPDRPVVVARELTKLHEEVWRGPLSLAAERYREGEVRGECVIVIGPAPAHRDAPSDQEVAAALTERMAAGAGRREAVAEVAAALGVPKRRVYDLAIGLGNGR